MPTPITMPQLSDTMAEGVLVKWRKKEGDKVRAGEEIADVETDKATMPMESFEAGTLAFLAVKEGDKVKVGGLLAVVSAANEDAAAVKKQYASGSVAPAAPATAAPKHNDRETDHPKLEEERKQSRRDQVAIGTHSHPSGATAVAEPVLATRNQPTRGRVSPVARRIAEDKGIDLGSFAGSGPGGRIIKRDVLQMIQNAPLPASGKQPTGATPGKAKPMPLLAAGQTDVVPMSKLRQAIAAALQRSKQTVPHFYETIDVDVEQIGKVRERLNERLEAEGVRLSIADFVLKGVATALKLHPNVNARFNSEKMELVRYGDVNVGIAVAIPGGLIVPVLRSAQAMGLKEIRLKSADLIDRARAQRLRREELSEATFTITSLGTYGIREFSAIINPPEVAILAVGAADKRAVVRGGQIVARSIMTLTLSCDHRVVDGATAAEFMKTLRETLEEPGMMLE